MNLKCSDVMTYRVTELEQLPPCVNSLAARAERIETSRKVCVQIIVAEACKPTPKQPTIETQPAIDTRPAIVKRATRCLPPHLLGIDAFCLRWKKGTQRARERREARAGGDANQRVLPWSRVCRSRLPGGVFAGGTAAVDCECRKK